MVSYLDIEKQVEPLGLCLRGALKEGGLTYILVGNVGSHIWEKFGVQYDDWIEPDPLDSWTKKTIGQVASDLNCQAVYPFDGPDFPPFQSWAMQADTVFQSPIGPLIHPEYGLWHAYRAALVFDSDVDDLPVRKEGKSPCKSCLTKPCLVSCPVEAFNGKDFRFHKCIDHLNKNLEGSCMRKGCLARMACPSGAKYRYEPAHAHFHMDKFIHSGFAQDQ